MNKVNTGGKEQAEIERLRARVKELEYERIRWRDRYAVLFASHRAGNFQQVSGTENIFDGWYEEINQEYRESPEPPE